MHRQTDKEEKEKSNPSASAVIISFVQCAVVSSSTHYCNHQPSGISHGKRGDERERENGRSLSAEGDVLDQITQSDKILPAHKIHWKWTVQTQFLLTKRLASLSSRHCTDQRQRHLDYHYN